MCTPSIYDYQPISSLYGIFVLKMREWHHERNASEQNGAIVHRLKRISDSSVFVLEYFFFYYLYFKRFRRDWVGLDKRLWNITNVALRFLSGLTRRIVNDDNKNTLCLCTTCAKVLGMVRIQLNKTKHTGLSLLGSN